MNDSRRFPINNAIGRPKQEGQLSQLAAQLLGSVQGSQAGPMLDPSVFEGAPPWVAYLMNLVQTAMAEHAALKLALLRRGLLTEVEIAEATMQIAREYENQFVGMVQQIDRRVNQQPTQPQPSDPRRSPTP